MNKEETLALYNKGREAWNAWAKEMLDGRDTELQQGNNLATQDWLTSATADFSGHTFKTDTDFTDFVFPGDAMFTGTQFAKETRFRGAKFSGEAGFGGAIFGGETWFDGATFSGEARFERAMFSGWAWFEATFRDSAWFKGAIFSEGAGFLEVMFRDWAWFQGATFTGEASFERATFSDGAGFGEATFTGKALFSGAIFSVEAWFEGAEFRGNTEFNQAIFESFADLSGAVFQKEANFVAIKGHSFFTLKNVRFLSVPDFEQAHFAEAPRLDHLSVQASGNESDIAAKWRTLRRLAVQGHDHERELLFLAEEIKALRGVQDQLLPCPINLFKDEKIWVGGGRYWAGLFYQWFSDFGRSTGRPLLCWMIAAAVFALYYLSAHLEFSDLEFSGWGSAKAFSTIPPLSCVSETSSSPVMAAIYLSVNNGLVISGLGRSEKLMQSYACLYGKNELDPIMPDAVVFVGIAQTILSAVLIFLFLLALRNYFRIK